MAVRLPDRPSRWTSGIRFHLFALVVGLIMPLVGVSLFFFGQSKDDVILIIIVGSVMMGLGLIGAVGIAKRLIDPTMSLLQQVKALGHGTNLPIPDLGVAEYDALRAELSTTGRAVENVARRMEMIIAGTGIGIWEGDYSTGIHVLSSSMFRLLGVPPTSDCKIHRAAWMELIHPEDRVRLISSVQAAYTSEQPVFQITYRVNRPDGSVRWLEVLGRFNEERRHSVGIAIDVTERMELQERRFLLAREVDHRAKNLLTLAQSVVRLAKAPDVCSLKGVIEQRLIALSRSHSLTVESGWTSTPLADILASEIGDYRDQFCVNGPVANIEAVAVQSVSMIFHELITNAIKYGALSSTIGTVNVSWVVDATDLVITWSEHGGPAVAPPSSLGFGSRMISINLRQLNGSKECLWEPSGLRSIIRLPLKQHIRIQNNA